MTRRRAAITGIVVGAVVAVVAFTLAALWITQRDRVLPNTVVAGVDVSGATAEEVRALLEPVAERRATEPLTLRLPEEALPHEHARVELVPADIGYRVDVAGTVEAVLERGRTGLPGDVVERVRAFSTEREIALVHDDELQLGPWVEELADRLDREEQSGDVVIDPEELDVSIEPSHGLVDVDRDALTSQLRDRLTGERDGSEVAIPATTTAQPISDVDLEAAAHTVTTAIEEPLELSAVEESLVLERRDLAQLMDVEEVEGGVTGTTLEVVITDTAVTELIGEVASERFDVQAVDASYSTSRAPPRRFDDQGSTTYTPVESDVEVVEGRDGRRFDADRAAVQLTELVRAGARQAELDLAREEPAFSTDDARELRPTHAIGTFTTYYTAGQTRVRNIQHLADVIDGTLVLPGEQFSINEVSGPRTCERGYFPAGTIVNGELVDTCGGGTSQFGTTTFNAAFFAGVQLDQWKAHSWYISRYPMGREATLSYPQLDVKFTNNTDGAVLVKTSHTATSVTVTLHGRPRATAVHAQLGEPYNHRGYEVEVRRTNDLTEGQERIEQSGANGFQVQVTRTVDLVDDGEETRTITTTYVPQRRIVVRGTAPADEEEEAA